MLANFFLLFLEFVLYVCIPLLYNKVTMKFPELKFDLKQIAKQINNLERIEDIALIDPKYGYGAWLFMDKVRIMATVQTNTRVENIGIADVNYDNWQQFLKINEGIRIECNEFLIVTSLPMITTLTPLMPYELMFMVETNGTQFKVVEADQKLPTLIFEGCEIFFELMNSLNPNNADWVHSSMSLKNFTLKGSNSEFHVLCRDFVMPFYVVESLLKAPITGTRLIVI
jgi:hypothetical protein